MASSARIPHGRNVSSNPTAICSLLCHLGPTRFRCACVTVRHKNSTGTGQKLHTSNCSLSYSRHMMCKVSPFRRLPWKRKTVDLRHWRRCYRVLCSLPRDRPKTHRPGSYKLVANEICRQRSADCGSKPTKRQLRASWADVLDRSEASSVNKKTIVAMSPKRSPIRLL